MSAHIIHVSEVAETLAEQAVQRIADASVWVIFRLNRVES